MFRRLVVVIEIRGRDRQIDSRERGHLKENILIGKIMLMMMGNLNRN